MRVYIVDDDPLLRRMVARMLSAATVEHHEFASAATFLEQLGTLPFGCVLLDVGMPDHNGLDVLAEVISRQSFPVVMASGSTDMNDAINAFRSGAVHFLRKPFNRTTLLASWLRLRRLVFVARRKRIFGLKPAA